LREAVDLYRHLKDSQQAAETLRALLRARATWAVPPGPEAHELMDLDRKLNAPADKLAEDEFYLARRYYADRNFKAAFQHLNEGLRLASVSGNDRLLAAGHELKGNIHDFRGEIIEALAEWRQAAQLYGRVGDRIHQAHALQSLGAWLFEIGNHDEAFRTLEVALEMSQPAESSAGNLRDWFLNRSTQADCVGTLANIYRRMGQPLEALKLFDQARRKTQFSLFPGRAPMYAVDIAGLYAEAGDHWRAEHYYELALAQSPFNPTDLEALQPLKVRIGYARFLTQTGRPKEALDLLDEAWAIASRHGTSSFEAECLLTRAETQLAPKTATGALDHLRQALKIISSRVPVPALIWRAYYLKGRALELMGWHVEALSEYERAIDVITRWLRGMPQSSETAVQTEIAIWEPYHAAIRQYLRRQDYGRVFRVAEQAKVGLVSLLANKARVDQWLSPKERAEERRRYDNLVQLRYALMNEGKAFAAPQWLRAEQDYHSYRESLYRRHPEVSAALGQLPNVSLRDAQRIVYRAGVAVLEYVVMGNDAFVILIDRNGSLVSPLTADSSQIRNFVAELAGPYRFDPAGASRSASYPPAASALYRALVPPVIEARLKQSSALCVIPDDFLWSVPFEMLWSYQQGQRKYLVERFAVTYAPSVSAMRLFMDRSERLSSDKKGEPLRVALVGNPQLPPSGTVRDSFRGNFFGRLVDAEASILRQIFGSRAVIFQGRQATRQAAMRALEESDIVHFACHGIYNEAYPLYSSLLMSPQREDSGFLEARDLVSLKIKARLVALAACDSGRGQTVKGQGIIGFTWAAFAGGAGTCIATRWPVDRQATAQFFECFYRNLNQGTPMVRSFQKAQLKLIQAGSAGAFSSQPFYWAGFMLMGCERAALREKIQIGSHVVPQVFKAGYRHDHVHVDEKRVCVTEP
jgi:CHAT domain-containing protein